MTDDSLPADDGQTTARKQALKELALRQGVSDFDDDIVWAYQNMGDAKVEPDQAPSVAAWKMYEVASEDTTKFLTLYMGWREKKKKEAGPADLEMEKDKMTTSAALDKLARTLSANVDRTLKEISKLHPAEFERAIIGMGWQKA